MSATARPFYPETVIDRETHLLQLQPERLQPADGRHILALVALDPLDGHDAVGQLVGLLGLGGLGLCGLLLGVLCGALLGGDRERGGRGFEGFCCGGLVVGEEGHWVEGTGKRGMVVMGTHQQTISWNKGLGGSFGAILDTS